MHWRTYLEARPDGHGLGHEVGGLHYGLHRLVHHALVLREDVLEEILRGFDGG